MSVLFVKTQSGVFEPLFGGLSSNVRGLSLALWKTRSRLPVGDNWTIYASCYGWATTSGNTPNLAIFERVDLKRNITLKGYDSRQHL